MHELIGVEGIFDALILLEETGRDAYASLAGLARDNAASDLFIDLSRREESHRKLYVKMKDECCIESGIELDEDYRKYISVLIEHNFSLTRRAKAELGREEGIMIGIELEKQTILFLSDLYRILLGSVRDPILSVIKEEQGHLRALLKLQAELT